MKITFTLTKKDVWSCLWYTWCTQLRHPRKLLLQLSWLPLVIFGTSYMIAPSLVRNAEVAALICLLQILILMVVFFYSAWNPFKPTANGVRVMEIGKFDVCWTAPPLSGYYFHWTRFVDIARTPQMFLFHLQGNQALIVPRSAFTDDAEAERFLSLAQTRWQAAKTREFYRTPEEDGVWPPAPSIRI